MHHLHSFSKVTSLLPVHIGDYFFQIISINVLEGGDSEDAVDEAPAPALVAPSPNVTGRPIEEKGVGCRNRKKRKRKGSNPWNQSSVFPKETSTS